MGRDTTMRIISIISVLFVLLFLGSDGLASSSQQQLIALAATADENGVVQGKDGWLFLQEELEHLGSKGLYGPAVFESSKSVKKEFADPLPAIVDFNTQLKERGIELLFVPVPPKALIYSEKLPVELSSESVAELEQLYDDLYAKLREQGVNVLNLIPLFQAENVSKELYCKTDTHFSGVGITLLAGELLKGLSNGDWLAGIKKKNYSIQERTVSIHGDLSVMQKTDTREDVLLEFVTDSTSGKAEVADPASPVLLLGDSHTLVFSVGGDLHTSGAGLFDQLNAQLGFALDVLGVRGSGATPSRIKLYQRSRKDTSFLEKKKMVIWCLSARELTGSGGWRKIPIAKK